MQPELKYQKDLVKSAKIHKCLAEITTHRFKKGWPDVLIKDKRYPTFHIECKYEYARKTHSIIPIETTPLQRDCLKNMRTYGMLCFVSVCVELDKKVKRVYNIYDIEAKEFDMNTTPYYEKEKAIWPTNQMIMDAIKGEDLIPKGIGLLNGTFPLPE